MWYTYLLLSKKDDLWYTGCTKDLKERFTEHNSGKICSTAKRYPFVLLYYEACLNENDAFQREKYLKSGMGKRYLKNRLKKYFYERKNF